MWEMEVVLVVYKVSCPCRRVRCLYWACPEMFGDSQPRILPCCIMSRTHICLGLGGLTDRVEDMDLVQEDICMNRMGTILPL